MLRNVNLIILSNELARAIREGVWHLNMQFGLNPELVL